LIGKSGTDNGQGRPLITAAALGMSREVNSARRSRASPWMTSCRADVGVGTRPIRGRVPRCLAQADGGNIVILVDSLAADSVFDRITEIEVESDHSGFTRKSLVLELEGSAGAAQFEPMR
jgi:hypothetical protein